MTNHIKEISEIYIYPVKSCKGIKVNSWKVGEYGFQYDRFWMVVDYCNKYLTQREYPKLALVTPTIQENDDDDDGGLLILENPNNEQKLKLPLLPKENYSNHLVKVCDENVMAYDCGEESSKWISDYLGIKVRIVSKSTKESRLVKRNLPPKDELLKKPETAFSDGYPFLILSEESLSDLNKRLTTSVTCRRFRPNIVIKGCEKPFEEDTWKKIIIGESNENLFFVSSRCTRCIMTTINPNTGIKEGLEPLKTLQSYRRVDPGAKYYACFGMNVIHNKSGITLNVGDQVKVLETGEHIRENY